MQEFSSSGETLEYVIWSSVRKVEVSDPSFSYDSVIQNF